MKYLKTHFHIIPNTEDWRSIIAWAAGEVGYESFEDCDGGIIGYVQQQLFNEEALQQSITDSLFGDVECSHITTAVEDRNWNERWEQEGFEPIIIDSRCVVFDTKHIPEDKDEYLIQVEIDAKQAFGTGTHATTQLMINNLLSINIDGKKVLDCGCGTGILAITASKLGARQCFAYDIDDWSVNNTLHNIKLNNVNNIDVRQGNREIIGDSPDKYDVVMANINRNILLEDMPFFVKALLPEGFLLLSGFYEKDIEIIKSAIYAHGLSVVNEEVKEEWAIIVAKLSKV